ncbi:RNA polymerase sigma factor [Polyangium mundeleinium]|uniref:Sigma-70 family RNA polymerase sigma factor n=1 Tax=Polyangium mundeleinium TaxID=2995306 RepID=A0ABT5F0D3_9BACT|nr:sigma-70 family RNA polymerase sigma factor [Polyangium mundeleinium]MDC0747074.1 sigma-70 family RNA polymerase sigma factor [Polyangium mundeleinium]
MAENQYEDLERDIRRRLTEGDHEKATTLAIRGFGAEIFGFLVALHRDEQDAEEVFAAFSERLWRDVRTFRGDSSFRTWAYVLARHASLNYRRDTRRRENRQRPLPEGSELSAIVEQVRSETASYLRTERQLRFAALRASLPPEDQALLVLRIDRGLAWNELARVFHEGDAPQGKVELAREAARLRKRFQLLKVRLFEMGKRAGVVSEDPEGA